jgi:transposase
MAEIAAQGCCSIGLVSKVLQHYWEYGQVRNPFRQYTGRPSKLSEADLKYIDTIVTVNPSLTELLLIIEHDTGYRER